MKSVVMVMASKGWISVHREIQDHWVWEEKPFSKGQAWLDLLMMANHKDNKFVFNGELIEVARGAFITSELKLMERWGWSKSKVRNFLKMLENDSMITKKSDNRKTTLNIVNYSVYQDSETTERQVKDRRETTERPLKDINNNVNNENKDNKAIKFKFGEFSNVTLSDIEHKKLLDQYGHKSTEDFIEKLDAYIESTGKKYKSCYATILNWIKKEPSIKKIDQIRPVLSMDA